MIKAKAEFDKEQGACISSVEVNGKASDVLIEMCAIVRGFIQSNLQQAKEGKEQAIALFCGDKIVDAISEALKDYVEMKERSTKNDA